MLNGTYANQNNPIHTKNTERNIHLKNHHYDIKKIAIKMKRNIILAFVFLFSFRSFSQVHIDSVVVMPFSICSGDSITVKVYHKNYATTDSAFAFLSTVNIDAYISNALIKRTVFAVNPIIFKYKVASSLSSGFYRIYVKDTLIGLPIDTFSNRFILNIPTLGGSLSSSQTICSGMQPADLILSGQLGSVIKWQKSSDASFSTPIDINNTTTTLTGATIGALSTSSYFRVLVQNGACSAENSSSVLVTVNPSPTANAGAAVTPICKGGSTMGLGGSVGGGATGGIWSDGTLGGSFSPSANTLNAIWSPPSSYSGTATLTLTSTGGLCGSTSASKQINVYSIPVVDITAANVIICIGSNTTITGTATPVIPGITTYKIGTTSGGFDVYGTTALGSTTPPTFPMTVNPAINTTYYYTITNGPCSPVTSSVTIIVRAIPTVLLTASSNSICDGSSTSLNAITTNTIAGVTLYSISANPGGVLYSSSSTPPTFPFAITPSVTTTYTYAVSTPSCSTITSNTTVVFVPIPTANITASTPQCASTSLSLNLSNSNTVGGLTTYKISSDYPAPNSIVYASSLVSPGVAYTVNPSFINLSGPTNFTYTIVNGPCSPVAASASVTIFPEPTATISSPPLLCSNTNTILTLTTSNTTSGVTIYKITSDYPIAGTLVYGPTTIAPNSPLTVATNFSNPNGTTNYQYTVNTPPCNTFTASTAVTIRALPTANLSFSTNPLCFASSTSLTISISGAVAGITNYSVGTTLGGSNIIGSTTIMTNGTFSNSILLSPSPGDTKYYLTVNSLPCSIVSTNATLTVDSATNPGILSSGKIVCEGSINSNLFTLTNKTGNIIKWQISTNGGSTWRDTAVTSPFISANNINISTLYRAVVKSGSCVIANSNTSGIFVMKSPVVNFTTKPTCYKSGPTAFTNTTTSGGGLSAAIQTLFNINGILTIDTIYDWNFGNNTSGLLNTSTLESPTHNYTHDSVFQATLNATVNIRINSTIVSSCSGFKTNPVIILPQPTPPIFLATNPTSICNNQSGVNFGVTPVFGNKYTWKSTNAGVQFHGRNEPNTLIDFPNNGGPYSIFCITENFGGCRDSSKIDFTPNGTIANTPGLLLTNNGKTLICLDQKQLLYQWGYDSKSTFIGNDVSGATLQDYTPIGGFDFANNSYYVKIVSGGCTSKVYYNSPNAVDKKIKQNNFTILPNPNSGIFEITIKGDIVQRAMVISDILGHEISLPGIKQGTTKVEMQYLPNGIYFLHLLDIEGNRQSLKFIINK